MTRHGISQWLGGDGSGLRTAVAGLGRIGWGFHLQHCSHDPRFDVVAVVRRRLQKAEVGKWFELYAELASTKGIVSAEWNFSDEDSASL